MEKLVLKIVLNTKSAILNFSSVHRQCLYFYIFILNTTKCTVDLPTYVREVSSTAILCEGSKFNCHLMWGKYVLHTKLKALLKEEATSEDVQKLVEKDVEKTGLTDDEEEEDEEEGDDDDNDDKVEEKDGEKDDGDK